MSVIVVSALVLAPKGIKVQTYGDAAFVLNSAFGPIGFWLFAASLFIGCVGAAFELALDMSYLTAQTFGWNWGESEKPSDGPRFSMIYTGGLLLALVPALFAVDPLQLTMFSMCVTVIALPPVVAPLLVIMNDRRYLESFTNGLAANVAVAVIVVVAAALALVSIPLQLVGQ
jgi:Mn2+/Fe2+ NRAMP family transporter